MHIMDGALSATQMLDAAGENIRALYMAGSFLKEQLRGREGALGKVDFLVVQELFGTDTTAFADVVLPAASFAEVDGTFTNNDGFVQRVRQSIPPVHSSKPDWMITAHIANELGVDFGFQTSASADFKRQPVLSFARLLNAYRLTRSFAIHCSRTRHIPSRQNTPLPSAETYPRQ